MRTGACHILAGCLLAIAFLAVSAEVRAQCPPGYHEEGPRGCMPNGPGPMPYYPPPPGYYPPPPPPPPYYPAPCPPGTSWRYGACRPNPAPGFGFYIGPY